MSLLYNHLHAAAHLSVLPGPVRPVGRPAARSRPARDGGRAGTARGRRRRRVLKSGGNAIDAAVAVGFALAVTHPFAGNLGGGGFMLVRLADGRTTFIDFRERAPEKASHNMYLDANGKPTRDSVDGWRASGVPGSVRGFELARSEIRPQEMGRRDRAGHRARLEGISGQLFARRIAERLAQSCAVSPNRSASSRATARYYESTKPSSSPNWPRTLERIAKNGAKEFYEGETAQKLAAAMAKNGGLITLADLKNYDGRRAQAAHRQISQLRNDHRRLRPAPAASGCCR